MKPATAASTLLSCCTAAATAAAVVPAFDNNHDFRIPTSYESAVLGRRMLALTPLGTLSTVFPDDDDKKHSDGAASTQERRPPGLGGMPYGLMEYIADCEEHGDDNGGVGNPTILAITIGTTFKNAAAGSNVTLAVQWTPPYPPAKRIKSDDTMMTTTTTSRRRRGRRRSWLFSYFGLSTNNEADSRHAHDNDNDITPLPYSAANLPRFSLIGHLEPIEGGGEERVNSKLASCFVKTHPDAKYWLPGNRIHRAYFARLVVEQVYWVGGFGDRAFIGWIPLKEWQKVTREEWQDVRLPGEKKGWKEWSVAADL
ncbi:pyridoxamine 5'-phosphate oxidase-domain-containing protein [Chaetomidium leptoderma]|uniref:Pyridoxamine 5'-phosphate oxidase-domain-containing protein n=1 Tax=Chaetomidium leptoderma TaxID=669021 RepID=A0AAN6ZWS3_9PEZI|nr:pyridoxamine 5'-phosphate oxidase-domain-containing protein [Chaetomidium leptoderma]